MLDPRKKQVLKAIIDQFIRTAEPVGSQHIVVNYFLKVSPATIRNDMSILEKEGLIYQPHTSAGRIPTEFGYRIFIENFDEFEDIEKRAKNYIEKLKTRYFLEKAQEKIYNCVSILAEATSCISFATIPGKNRAFYLGISNILKQPEFIHEPLQASQIIEILEENDKFISILNELGINEKISVFIGKENLIQEIESCSVIATTYNYEGFNGKIGILGPTRMNYPFNG